MAEPADRLLLPSNTLNGPRQVTGTLRPMRVAYIVDPTDPAVALAAVQSACLTWGGQFHFLIPCAPGGEPAPPWAGALDKHDPDLLIDMVGVAPDYPSNQRARWGRIVWRWERPTQTMLLSGAAVYGALRRWRRLRPEGTTHVAAYFNPLAGHPLALPLAFRFGHIDVRPLDERSRFGDSYESAAHDQFLELAEIDPGTLTEDQLMQFVTDVSPQFPLDAIGPRPGNLNYWSFDDLARGRDTNIGRWTFPQLTTLYIPRRGPSYRLSDPTPEDEPQHDEAYARLVIVVGAPTSVPDLCLAWNLRAQHPAGGPLPVWVAPQWLTRPTIIQNISLSARVEDTTAFARLVSPAEAPQLHLVSASVSRDELAAAGSQLQAVTRDGAELDRFFSPGFKTGLDRQSIVTFRDGLAHVALPDQRELGDFHPLDWLGWAVSIGGYTMPRGSNRYFPRWGASSRTTREGFAGHINAEHIPDKLLAVDTNNGGEIVAGVAAQAGYQAEVSDKGQRAFPVLELLGGDTGLDVLASSRVYKLLLGMAEIEPRRTLRRILREMLGGQPSTEQLDEVQRAVQGSAIGHAQFDRQQRPWDQLQGALGESAEPVIKWLVARRILFRGYEVTCPNCGFTRWHPIDRLAEFHRCDGCQVESPIPIAVNKLDWRYRLNEVVAQAIDQGVLPHLLALRRMRDWPDLLGFLPGVTFTPREGNTPPPREADLFAVKGGRIIVGECKESGSELAERDIDRIAELSDLFGCSRVIYATPTDFSGVAALEQATSRGGAARVEIWQGQDLLDVNAAGSRRYDPPEYLAHIVPRLAARVDSRPAASLPSDWPA